MQKSDKIEIDWENTNNSIGDLNALKFIWIHFKTGGSWIQLNDYYLNIKKLNKTNNIETIQWNTNYWLVNRNGF